MPKMSDFVSQGFAVNAAIAAEATVKDSIIRGKRIIDREVRRGRKNSRRVLKVQAIVLARVRGAHGLALTARRVR